MEARPAGLWAPALAVALAVGIGGLVLAGYAQHRSDQISAWQAVTVAEAVAGAGTPAEMAGNAARFLTVRVVADDAAPRKYDFLRRLTYTAHPERAGEPLDLGDPEDKAAADAFVRGRDATQVVSRGRGHQAAAPARDGAVVVVDAGPLNDSGRIPWWLFVLVGLAGFAAWAALLRRTEAARWQGPAGAAMAGGALLALLVLGLLGVEVPAGYAVELAQNIVGSAVIGPPDEGELLVFAAPLLPLVLYATAGYVTRSRRSPHRTAYAYIAPAMVGMGVLVLVPFVIGLGLAFTRHAHGQFTWVGLTNFVQILTSEGHGITHPLSFYFTLAVTVLWTGLNVVLHAGIGLGLALVLNQPDLRFKGLFRVLLIVPWAVPNYITALIWKGMFNKQYGLINHVLGGLGIEPVGWFSQFWTAFTANVTTNTWLGFPFMMVVSLGALQSIPKDLYEAAEVDGASRWQQFRAITLPLLKPALFPAIVLGSIWTFNMFNIIYLVSGGQPDGSTDILITEAYRFAFEQDRYGYAAAYSVLIFLILLGYSLVTQRVSRAAEGAYE